MYDINDLDFKEITILNQSYSYFNNETFILCLNNDDDLMVYVLDHSLDMFEKTTLLNSHNKKNIEKNVDRYLFKNPIDLTLKENKFFEFVNKLPNIYWNFELLSYSQRGNLQFGNKTKSLPFRFYFQDRETAIMLKLKKS